MINACVAGLLFASIASFVFVAIDFMARRNKGPFNMSTAAGMGLFLFFILLQSGIATGALVRQTSVYVDFNQAYLDQMATLNDDDYYSNTDFTAESYGNIGILTATYVMAFFASGLIVIDAIFYRCCAGTRSEDHDVNDNTVDVIGKTTEPQSQAFDDKQGGPSSLNPSDSNTSPPWLQ